MPNTPNQPREYRIAPRYLANADADGSAAIQPLLDAGWALSRDEPGNTFVTAPDLCARLAHLPEFSGRALWKISAGPDAFAPPQWLVSFDYQTPPEVVADFTTHLAAAYAHGPDAYLKRDSRTTGVDTCLQLLADGWTMGPTTPFLTYQSPDQQIRLHYRDNHLTHSDEIVGDTERWLIEVGPPGQVWYATASTHLPEHLFQKLATAIANPAPAYRYLRRIDLDHLPSQATATPTAPSPLEVARIQAATARTAPRATASTLANPTATQPPTPQRFTSAGPTR
ncbi:DUF317 domain-containing protein [Kitasatospora acidiphila]|uniref:DUF317 domain-containing protein n=1 Tax=Kitasatospora acidiphila TaxID=2567942 RepID=A0A540VZ37_9ACTN|nr:DUF317 domain-containing protein [Kitasatospora acidiphila]TQF02025.1 DUF317 domain-containing protein [Kitasatospora acidiphila]